jgi:hypothetical protein
MKRIKDFKGFINEQEEKLIGKMLIDFLHEGIQMTSNEYSTLNEGSVDKADYELDRLLRRAEEKGETPIIKEFVPEVKAIVKKFAESGQSGGSAPFTTSVIIQVIEKLLKQEPLGGIENSDDEWGSLSSFGDDESYQNNRLSSVFKQGKEGKPYYLNAIVFRNPEKDYTFTSGSIDLPDLAGDGNGGKIGSSHYIKSFPFEPKTFIIDVEEKEYRKLKDGTLVEEEGGGWWESWVKDPSQLDQVWEYYDRKYPNRKK